PAPRRRHHRARLDPRALDEGGATRRILGGRGLRRDHRRPRGRGGRGAGEAAAWRWRAAYGGAGGVGPPRVWWRVLAYQRLDLSGALLGELRRDELVQASWIRLMS